MKIGIITIKRHANENFFFEYPTLEKAGLKNEELD